MNAAKPVITSIGTKKLKGADNVIIEKLYKPCKSVAKINPNMVNLILPWFFSEDKAAKYPTRPEQSVCRKVAPIKRIKLIVTVVFSMALNEIVSIGENKYSTFSRAANPRAATTI